MKRTGKAIGGPLDGRDVSSSARFVECADQNPDFDFVENGARDQYTDGKGNRQYIRTMYEFNTNRGAWLVVSSIATVGITQQLMETPNA